MSTHRVQHYTSPQAAKQACDSLRSQGLSIGYVATMGALHPGHASLVKKARQQNDKVIVSIFVNPLQFNKPEDLKKYPRDEAADMALLQLWQVDAVFTGSVADFLGATAQLSADELPDPGIYAQGLEGLHRPGHFSGVREIVSRLFGFVGPCKAYFGEKDYQQLKIIRQLAQSMAGIEVVACPTLRAASGLALSSRNQRLSPQGLVEAAVIYQAMQSVNLAWQQGERQPSALQATMLDVLLKSAIKLQYAEVRDPENWTVKQPRARPEQARVLIAGEIEGVRLIDNMALGEAG